MSKINVQNKIKSNFNYLENSNDFKQEDFRDSDHLSNKGAIKLSIKVDSIINKKPLS